MCSSGYIFSLEEAKCGRHSSQQTTRIPRKHTAYADSVAGFVHRRGLRIQVLHQESFFDLFSHNASPNKAVMSTLDHLQKSPEFKQICSPAQSCINRFGCHVVSSHATQPANIGQYKRALKKCTGLFGTTEA